MKKHLIADLIVEFSSKVEMYTGKKIIAVTIPRSLKMALMESIPGFNMRDVSQSTVGPFSVHQVTYYGIRIDFEGEE